MDFKYAQNWLLGIVCLVYGIYRIIRFFNLFMFLKKFLGEVAEWLKAHAWKACIRETVSRVRIPLSPPEA